MGILSWLWGEAPSVQVERVAGEKVDFEQRLERIVRNSQNLSNRTQEERQQLIEDVTEVLEIIGSAINVLEASHLVNRAKQALTMLRTIHTRTKRMAA